MIEGSSDMILAKPKGIAPAREGSEQISSDQTQIAPAPSRTSDLVLQPEDKSSYHPQMVDRFEG